ncbi:low temperature requirement protein A [Janthinobacterium psychrotolerans]|uniref:Low temperature requirement protein LtrA n=1 Tax=Janthinobacterium psychrotolerans TaxID=1747903 RepID=A0A1A7C943_9BURK|nr:low temperature requirement protein A [Janthinobacterium psychrotolerans]OBV41290.1 Low temperature requirement protein LtrA [Janthinobacterium psychrotolerans]
MELKTSLLRTRGRADSGKVSMIELFFDLVFVFAVTQLSHALLEHLSALGWLQTSLLLMAVWWVWIYTSWITNWLDPERMPVRLCLFVLMLGGLLMSASIPEAFGTRGLGFAGAYVAMQVGRPLFALWAVRGEDVARRRNFQRIALWAAFAGVFWLLGGAADPAVRIYWWAAALLVDLAGPWLLFKVPGLGSSSTGDWDIDGSHMSERCGLFVIIALGESLLVTGANFAGLEWTAANWTGFISALLGSVAMWWLYFDKGAELGHALIAGSKDPGRIARRAYTYIHMLIIGGIIVSAVADELSLLYPDETSFAGICAMLGGPILYLLGNALFKWVSSERSTPPLSHVLGILMIMALIPMAFGRLYTPLILACITTGVLVLVAIWEYMALRRPPPELDP